MSYNPSYESHQKLLLRAVKQEEKRLKKDQKVERATTKMFPTIDKAPTQASWLTEMSEGLPNVDEDEENEDEEDEEEENEENGKTAEVKEKEKGKEDKDNEDVTDDQENEVSN